MIALGLPFSRPDDGVVLRAQFDARHVFHAHDAAIGRLADDDLAELFRRSQPALRADGVSEFLALRGSARRRPGRRG